ncbi:hypothetical protein BDV33DRAFT_210654 [Aspergillus novoparasiticus]|uniref:Uncharacterized protein n=1 Tax=Aspergillus novoparasiticus TaxID=986946 RepID=A0A5N6E5X7_9EURO|nr:hypothetical protein BDV33DRAFT_210654 [Aspergillus novoparasiticus]
MLQGQAELEAAADGETQEERVAQERADALARLESSSGLMPLSLEATEAMAVHRPVTELPAELPNMLPDSAKRGAHQIAESIPQSPTEGQRESAGLQNDQSLPQSRANGQQTNRKPFKPGKLRKQRMKNRLTHRDVNRLGTRDAALDDELWGTNEDDAADSFQLSDEPLQLSAVPVQNAATAGVTDARPPQQDSRTYTNEQPDPKHVQEAIERQVAEESLFDPPSMPIDQETPTAARVRSERKKL